MQLTLNNTEFKELKDALGLYIATLNGNFKIVLENINEESLEKMSVYNKEDVARLLDNIHRQEICNIQRKIFSDDIHDNETLKVAGQLYNNFSVLNGFNSEISIDITDKEHFVLLNAIKNKKIISENNVEDYLNNIFELNEESKIFASIITKILSNYKEYRNYSTITKYDNLIQKIQ